jgi:type IV secretory pathway VirB6-like protein
MNGYPAIWMQPRNADIAEGRSRLWRRAMGGILCVALAFFFSGLNPGEALAGNASPAFAISINDSFSCNAAAGSPNSRVFTNTTASADGVFSYVLIAFQTSLFTAMAQGYCAVRNAVSDTLYAAVLLSVVAFAIAFLMGITRFSVREAMILIFKISLVLVFALNAQVAMSIVFKFFLAVSMDPIGWVNGNTGVSFTAQDSDFKKMADLFDDTTRPCSKQVLLFIVLMAGFIPVLGAPVIIAMLTFVMLFVRAILGFLTGLGAVSLLMATSPLFISFALFKTTYGFFDRWLRSMISYSIQMVLVFMIIFVSIGFFDFYAMFDNLESTLAPADVARMDSALFNMTVVKDVCMPCQGFKYTPGTVNFVASCDEPRRGLPLSSMVTVSLRLYAPYIVTNILWLMILLWGVMEVITAAPMIAFSLAGDYASMTLGGRVGRTMDPLHRDERHQFDMGGIDNRMDRFITGFKFGYDPSSNSQAFKALREKDPNFGKIDNPLMAPLERIGHGLKMGVGLARSDTTPEAFFQDLVPNNVKAQNNYYKQQEVTAKNQQYMTVARANRDNARSQVAAGTLPEEALKRIQADYEAAKEEFALSQQELERLESEYMKTVDVMSNDPS